MNRRILLVVANVLCCCMMFGIIAKHHRRPRVVPVPPVQQQEQPVTPPIVPPSQPTPPVEPKAEEPKWVGYPAIRHVDHLGVVLSDIESHMPANHIYRDSDKITWAHETTHGLASNIRQKFSKAGYVDIKEELLVFHSADRINGFYVLKDRAIVLHEPSGTLSQVAAAVPQGLRGDVYGLYLQRQASSWNNEPLYAFDEWCAYTNGSETRLDLKISGRAETVQYMMEFCLYAICLNKALNPDQEVKAFTKWNLERCMGVMKNNQSLGCPGAEAYWAKVKANSEIKQFCSVYFGQEWCQRVLGL